MRDRRLDAAGKNLSLKQTRSHIPTRRKRNKNGVHIAATDFCTHQKNEVADDERPSDALCSRSVRRRSHDLSPFTCVQLYTRNNSHTLGYYPTLLSNVATSLLPQFYDGILAITHAHTRNITVCDVTVARRAPAIHQSIHTTTVHTNSYKYGRRPKNLHTQHTHKCSTSPIFPLFSPPPRPPSHTLPLLPRACPLHTPVETPKKAKMKRR